MTTVSTKELCNKIYAFLADGPKTLAECTVHVGLPDWIGIQRVANDRPEPWEQGSFAGPSGIGDTGSQCYYRV